MLRSRKIKLVIGGSSLFALSLVTYILLTGPAWTGDVERESVDITMYTEQFAFSPSRIAVIRGQRVNLRIISKDVTHGIFIDGYGIKKEVVPGRPTVVSFVTDRPGKIQIRCSVICGPLHPFMLGEIMVQPNTPFLASSIVLLLLGAAVIGFVETRPKARADNPHPQTLRAGLDLFRFSWIKRIFDWRGFQFALIIPGLAASILVILTGFWGTPIGAKNFSMISVWVIWWGALVVFLLPFGARGWCAACPMPAVGEWISRGAFVDRASRSFSLGFGWPKQFRNRWLVNIGLTLVLLLGLVITTRPWVTALLILSLILAAALLHFFFERRAFCRYICPIGGFLGLYAMISPLELRSKDEAVCRRCRYKACYRGSSPASEGDGGKAAYPCPVFEFTGAIERNTDCILCSECVKACPYDNVALRTRPFFADLTNRKKWRLDEAWLSLIMLGGGLANLAVKLGHWGWLKEWANLQETKGFLLYGLVFLFWTVGVVPAIHWVVSWLSRTLSGRPDLTTKAIFIGYAYALVPLSLMIWVAFTLSFVLPNLSYVASVVSDPFGWGVDLFGIREEPWRPYLTGWLPYVQVVSLAIGLGLALKAGKEIAVRLVGKGKEAALQAILPFGLFSTAMTILFLALFRG